MKSILILGAGGHGKVVAEVAKACGYDQIDFLDDTNPKAKDTISMLTDYVSVYDSYFVGIGDAKTREYLQKKLQVLGCHIPTLVHPSAYVSETATLEKGTIIEPMSIINAEVRIGEGCIISVGAIIDHEAIIGDFAHINAGAVCKSCSTVDAYQKIEAGEIVKGQCHV